MSRAAIKMAAPCRLEPHPLLAVMPMQQDVITRLKAKANDSEKVDQIKEAEGDWAAFVQDVAANGILEPIRAVPHGEGWLIADGRHRLAALIEAGAEIEDECVPIIEIAEAEALRTIESAVIARRHLTKSARAWMAICLHPKAAGDGKKGPNSALSAEFTQEELAGRWGVSVRMIEDAASLYRKLADAPRSRATIELSIWAGTGLRQLINGLAGGEAQTGAKVEAAIPFRSWKIGIERSLKRARESYANWEPGDCEAAVEQIAAVKSELAEIEQALSARIGGVA